MLLHAENESRKEKQRTAPRFKFTHVPVGRVSQFVFISSSEATRREKHTLYKHGSGC